MKGIVCGHGEFDTEFYVAIIFIYMKHITAVGVCESIASNVTRHGAIYLQQRHEMRISGGVSLGGEVTGGGNPCSVTNV